MKQTAWTMIIALSLLACERAGNDVRETPPDAPGDEAPDTGPGQMPGAGNPLEPDLRIQCELEQGYRAYLDGTGRETQRWTSSIAVAGVEPPIGVPWLCFDEIPDTDCRVAANCEYRGQVMHAKCVPSSWTVSDGGLYYVACGIRQELDLDGDGTFTLQADAPQAHIAVTAP